MAVTEGDPQVTEAQGVGRIPPSLLEGPRTVEATRLCAPGTQRGAQDGHRGK